MTVLLPKKASKITPPAVTRREAKEATKLQELNPRANTKLRKKVRRNQSFAFVLICMCIVLVFKVLRISASVIWEFSATHVTLNESEVSTSIT